ncbi:MAG: signal transduction histidine kinase/ActR/RegA family two-component response regulator [Lentimonas sp.]|jgi:signal transduction histidine kinase/ActR/RegA family two-component response regulator/integral membrane sensor domain MASE1
MKRRDLIFGMYNILTFLSVAFAAQVAVIVADPRFGNHINQIAPVFGVALGIVWVGGLRYLPAIFLGALLPVFFTEESFLMMLSVPLATVASAALSQRLLHELRVRINMERIRDALLIIFCGILVSTCFGAIIESVFQCRSHGGIQWEAFRPLFLTNWLAAGVGSIIITPFILAWADRDGFQLKSQQFLEVGVWLFILVTFGLVTFLNWAPTDVLFYPMELAIFPIMAWSAIRFGLRGASAGVLVLAVTAVWALIPVFTGGGRITQSPANVWMFVGIVSITSICLAAVMTELRRRESQIAENESRLRAFTGALPDIAFVLSKEGNIVDMFSANSSIEANHRITNPERVINQPLSSVLDDKVCQSFLDTISTTLTSNAVQSLEYSLESVDVGKHWFDARVSPMHLEGGDEGRVVWVAYDITCRRNAEADIIQRDVVLDATARANHTLLTTVNFGNAIERAMREIGIALRVERSVVFEITGHRAESFHTCNPRFEWLKDDSYKSILNYPSLQDAPFEDFFPGWYEQLMEGDIICLEGANEHCLKPSVLRELGSMSLVVVPMWVEGELYGFLAVDHCNQKHHWNESEINAVRVIASSISGLILICEREEELRVARDHANSASLAKGDFLAMMSHEIRTPMNAIIGYTDLILQTELDEIQVDHASIIKRSGKALLNLINNILDYSKIEARTLELESDQFDIEQVMCEALGYVLPMANDKGLQVDYDIDSAIGEVYIGDAHRIRQILMNLASNAVKFTREGSVLLSVRKNTWKSNEHSDMLRFEVQDTGCGIARDGFDLLFKPFSQVGASTARQFGGTGLGLVICQRLVERMGGEIWAESTLGEGSSFQFMIPLSRPDQLLASTTTVVSHVKADNTDSDLLQDDFAQAHPLRLLLCEDDEDNRWVMKELLEILGYEPHVAQDGDQAIEIMQQGIYDVVLMDVRLPGRSGIELTQDIRSGACEGNDPLQYIIAVTAFAMNEDRDKCLAAGMNDYLSKPLEVALLKAGLIRAHTALFS